MTSVRISKKKAATHEQQVKSELQAVEVAFAREYARYEQAFHRLATM